MEVSNALALRQSLGKILARLKKTGAPILIQKGKQPVAVLITLEDYQRRFVDIEADAQRTASQARILKAKLPLPTGFVNSLDLLHATRGQGE
jgi:prevent-host-death family protein